MLKKLKAPLEGTIKIGKIWFWTSAAFLCIVTAFYVTYQTGQMEACNAMLRMDEINTRKFGLYCDQRPEGVVVRSTVLKKSLFNITTDTVY